MPDESSHLALANHNQDLLDRLIAEVSRFPDWTATLAFYKALHVVEAALACENPRRHGMDHAHRERILKSDNRYKNIYKNYRVLYAASMVARYMEDDKTKFADYMPPSQVIGTLLRYRLHEVEKSASSKLRHPNQLVTIASRLGPTPPTQQVPPATS